MGHVAAQAIAHVKSNHTRLILALGVPAALTLVRVLPGLVAFGWKWDTALYAGMSSLAFERSQWLGLPAGEYVYMNKPPLWFVVQGCWQAVAGHAPIAIKAPSAVAVVLCATAVALLTLCLAPRAIATRSAMIAGCVFALLPPITEQSAAVQLDFPQLLLMCLSLTIGLALPRVRSSSWLVGGGLLCGATMLIKPFMGLVVPAFFMLAYPCTRSRPQLRYGIASGALAVAMALPWYIAMWSRYGSGFIETAIGREVVSRALGSEFSANAPGQWLLGPQLSANLGWALIPVGIAMLAAVFVPVGDASDRLSQRLLALWIGLWTVGFAAFGGDHATYLLPITPPACALLAIAISRLVPKRTPRSVVVAVGVVVLVGSASRSVRDIAAHDNAEHKRHADGWRPMLDAVRAAEAQGRPVFGGNLEHTACAIIYLNTGHWPLGGRDYGQTRLCPDNWKPPEFSPGSLVIYRTARLNDQLVGIDPTRLERARWFTLYTPPADPTNEP